MHSIVLKGDSLERGRQLGEAFRGEIRVQIEPFTASAMGEKRRELASEYRSVFEYTSRHAPELIDEMHGIAQAAGCEFEAVFWRHNNRAIEAITSERTDQQCTAFAAVTVDAGLIMVDTVDLGTSGIGESPLIHYRDRDFVLHRIVPPAGPRYMQLCRGGTILGGVGMNESGLANGWQSLPNYSNKTGVGLCYHLAPRVLLSRAGTTDEAVELLKRWVVLGNSKCWTLVDGVGHYLAVEKSFNRTGVLEPQDSLLLHANDYLSPEMQDLARGDQNSRDRIVTLERYFSQARDNNEPITLQLMTDCLRLHAQAGSICRHGEVGPADDEFHTVGAVLYIPARREMKVVVGSHPCEADLETFGFDF